jgi:hypothetical protein
MEGLSLFNVIIWAIAGAMNLSCKEVSKYSYAMTWVVLMVYLICDCVK